jgi:hypothetical protein
MRIRLPIAAMANKIFIETEDANYRVKKGAGGGFGDEELKGVGMG